jgi:hypothetical protein
LQSTVFKNPGVTVGHVYNDLDSIGRLVAGELFCMQTGLREETPIQRLIICEINSISTLH